ncbi:hypothetical protein PHYBOEH_001247 [Phytophthora boehmeriae]|uniref:Uncharacterized protein n=1 Tax=Phytophthora boehmeriae TaxID=109152 RepID=A0A8T1WUF3_9STRA|nr:hypothetical protein PHYBOEH_001247 [Phytophthora boehmeriae]
MNLKESREQAQDVSGLISSRLARGVAMDDEDTAWFGRQSEDELNSDDCPAYSAQLMDTHGIKELRAALRRSEVQIQKEGRLQEFVAPKTNRSPSVTLRPSFGLPRSNQAMNRQTKSAGPSMRVGAADQTEERPKTSSGAIRSMPVGIRAEEFSRVLKEETRQVRELERRYEDTKRSLLDYIDVVISCKPNDRVGGQEVYEQLADLLSFAAQCGTQEEHE